MVLYAESRVINNVSILENAKFLMHLSAKIYSSARLKEQRERRKAKKKKTK
jgi:hypothetical protein